jgi:hypothetical protein
MWCGTPRSKYGTKHIRADRLDDLQLTKYRSSVYRRVGVVSDPPVNLA